MNNKKEEKQSNLYKPTQWLTTLTQFHKQEGTELENVGESSKEHVLTQQCHCHHHHQTDQHSQTMSGGHHRGMLLPTGGYSLGWIQGWMRLRWEWCVWEHGQWNGIGGPA